MKRSYLIQEATERACPWGKRAVVSAGCGRLAGVIAVVLSFALSPAASSAVVYSGLRNVVIPTNFDGVYLDLETGTTSSVPMAGWDINPFFGGVGIAGSAAFQPARVGTGNMDSVRRFEEGDLIDEMLFYSTGENGSSDHLNALWGFQEGVSGYLGFRFMTNEANGPYYGWMRLTVTANTVGAVIHEWFWDEEGTAVRAGWLEAIPEPSRAMLLMMGLWAGAFARRRR